jgi:hypothetical protein
VIPTPRRTSDATHPAAGDLSGLTPAELHRQRRLLGDELRGIRYSRRIARAQTDLLVAALLYRGREDLDGLHTDPTSAPTLPRGGPAEDAGGRLLTLRRRDRLMAGYEHSVRADLDRVTRELAARVQAGSIRSPVG